MAIIKDESVQLAVSDGTEMAAFVARPPAGRRPRPGIMIFQEAFGVNNHIREVTRRFAAQGYVAIAPEMFHRTAPGFDGAYGNPEPAMANLRALTVDGMQADVRAAYDWLRSDSGVDPDEIVCAGYCMGGRVAYLANATVSLCAAISYYGGGIAPALLDRAGDLQAPVLFFWGGLDKHIPSSQHRAVADALTEAKKEFVNVEFSNADHGFFCDERPSFSASAAAQSWALSVEFLRENLE